MSVDYSTLLMSVLGSLTAGGGLGTYFTYSLGKKRLDGDQTLAIEAQTLRAYEALYARQEARSAAQDARIAKLELDNAKCMDEHIEMAGKYGEVLGRLSEQGATITRLQGEVSRNARAVEHTPDVSTVERELGQLHAQVDGVATNMKEQREVKHQHAGKLQEHELRLAMIEKDKQPSSGDPVPPQH